MVRIEPGGESGATSAMAHWDKLDGQKSYQRKRSAPLENRLSPTLAYLTNTGALVTIGDWNENRNLMLAVYSPDGKLLQSSSLMDLFRSEYLACVLHKADEERGNDGVGPLYWLARGESFSERGERVFVRDRLSGSLEVDTRNGEVESLEAECKLPLGEMTWELGDLRQWKPSRYLPSAFTGKTYLLKIFSMVDRKWRLEQVVAECREWKCSSYDDLKKLLSRDARITGRGELLGLPIVYLELFESDSGIKQVAALSGDGRRSMRLNIQWRPRKQDETAAVMAELKSLIAGMRRVPESGAAIELSGRGRTGSPDGTSPSNNAE
jgi:hypothetical protein